MIDEELLVNGVQMYIYEYDPKVINNTGSFFWDYKRFGDTCKKIPIEEYNKHIRGCYPSRIDWLKGPEAIPFSCEVCGSKHIISNGSCINCSNKYETERVERYIKYISGTKWQK